MTERTQETPSRLLSIIGLAWGLSFICAVLLYAIVRLFSVSIDAFSHFPFYWYHWVSLAAVVVFMAHSEGYQGFQQNFSPRVVARAWYLYHHPRPVLIALAPLFLAGYIHINPSRRKNILALTIGIVILIFLIRYLPQPWRGIVDAGVVVGLTWGLVSMAVYGIRMLGSRSFAYSPEIPGESEVIQ
jgi:hypothetical protein